MQEVRCVLRTLLLAFAVSAILGCVGNAQRQTTGEYVDDSWITSRIKAAFIEDKTLNAPEINIETHKGAVQLSGVVSDPGDVEHASDVARSIKGVASVENNLQVK